MIKPSLVILTWNRKPSVEASLSFNLASAGYPIHEIIHVDNGSDPGFSEWFREKFKPSVQVIHKENEGVAKGYNRGLALASGTHVMITGCDRVMPENWLLSWVTALEKVPETGVISCYSNAEDISDRFHKEHGVYSPPEERNGIQLRRAIPVEARIHSKEFLFKAGYFREDFGRYGYEDAEWSDRANKTAASLGLINYILPGMGLAKHLPDIDFPHEIDGMSYKEYKKYIHSDPRRPALFKWCWANGSPYYNPYSQLEINRLEEML